MGYNILINIREKGGFIMASKTISYIDYDVPQNCPQCFKRIIHYNLIAKTPISEQQIITENKYSYKKGLLGATLFGPMGAVAGVNGKNGTTHIIGQNVDNITIQCPNCNYMFSMTVAKH